MKSPRDEVTNHLATISSLLGSAGGIKPSLQLGDEPLKFSRPAG